MPQRLPYYLPSWSILLIGLLLVVAIGYIDYISGDYSILVFYLIPVSFVCWYGGRWGGFAVSAASGVARFLSDASLYNKPSLHYWNSVEDMVFLMVVCLLVSVLRKELKVEKGKREA